MTLARTLCAASSAAVALGGIALAAPVSAAMPTTMPTTTAKTVVIDCSGQGVVRPKQIVLSCADDGVSVTNLRWTTWTLNGATGTGTLVWNTCLPHTCAAGIVQKYAVRVRLGRVASGPGIDVFSGMTLAFPQGGPAAAETATYTLDNPQH